MERQRLGLPRAFLDPLVSVWPAVAAHVLSISRATATVEITVFLGLLPTAGQISMLLADPR